MSNLISHVFNDTTVRAIDRDGEIWFVAADVCKALEINNVTKAVYGLDDDEKMTLTNSKGRAGQGAQSYNIINESGLYSLVLRSRKPEAKRFKKWVTSEVLPSIRKTGSYSLTISIQQQHEIKEAVHQNVSRTGRTFQAVYHDLYLRFQIPKYQDLLARDFDAAIKYLGTLQLEYKKRYDFPIETADLPDRQFANALITPRVMLDKRNPAPDLELLKALEQDGYDITGAKVRIHALYNIVQHIFIMRQDINKARQYLAYVDKIVENTTVERGLNVFFAGVQKGKGLECFEPRFL